MDDYLAKPVKGKTLEKMLVRWAIQKRALPREKWGFAGLDCSESGEHNCGTAAIPIYGQGGKRGDKNKNKSSHSDLCNLTGPGEGGIEILSSRPTMSERQNSHRLRLPGTESEGDRAEMREEAEEKATALRDEKLVEAAGVTGGIPASMDGAVSPGQRLTEENVGRLESEVLARTPRSETRLNGGTGIAGGDRDEGVMSSDEGQSRESSQRPGMTSRRWMDSERTVRG